MNTLVLPTDYSDAYIYLPNGKVNKSDVNTYNDLLDEVISWNDLKFEADTNSYHIYMQ